MKKLFLLAALFVPLAVSAQIVRVDQPLLVTGPNVPSSGGPLPQALFLSNATVSICTHPATVNSCVPVTTYTDSTGATSCPVNQQMVQLPGSACTASVGAGANIGFWYSGGTVDYVVNSPNYGTFGPYTVSGASGAGIFVALGQSLNQTMIGSLTLPESYTSIDPYINLAAYGCVPNSSGAAAANSTCVAAAITAACAQGGGRIHVPVGLFYLSSTIQVPCGNLIWEGSGYDVNSLPASRFSFPAGIGGMKVTGDGGEIRELGFIGNATGSGSDIGVWLPGPIYPKLERVYVSGFGSHGIYLDNSSSGSNGNYWSLYDNFSTNNYGDGFHWEGSGSTNLNVGKAVGNTAQLNHGWGFWMDVVDSSTFIANGAEANTSGGFQISNSQNDYFLNNYCEVGAGSTMSFAASDLGMKVWNPLFGTCNPVDNATDVGTNEIQSTLQAPYYGQPYSRQLELGPLAGTSGHYWFLYDGVTNANDFSIFDGTTATTWLDFNAANSNAVFGEAVIAPYFTPTSSPGGGGLHLNGSPNPPIEIANNNNGFDIVNQALTNKLFTMDNSGNADFPLGTQTVNNLVVNGSCSGCSGSSVTLQTNSSNNSSQTLLNMETSTANSVGLTVTPSNPSGGIEKWEVTGSNYTGTAETATVATTIATTGGSSTNSTFYPVFVASNSSSNQAATTTSGYNFNPSTGLLTTPSLAVTNGYRQIACYSPGAMGTSASTPYAMGGCGGSAGNFTTGLSSGNSAVLIPFADTIVAMYALCTTKGTSSGDALFLYTRAALASTWTQSTMTVVYGSGQTNETMYSDTTHTQSISAGTQIAVAAVSTGSSSALANCSVTLIH